MSAPAPVYEMESASEADIRVHLLLCDGQFSPPLSQRLDLRAYARKLRQNACTFEAWSDGTLVGLLAAYLNDRAAGQGYISHICTLAPFAGRGVASNLMGRCIREARERGMVVILLEAAADNHRARSFYERQGFHPFQGALMKLDLGGVNGQTA